MKFRAHDTFFIRRGWLDKGVRAVVDSGGNVFVNKDGDNPMDALGIGANMVKALRYWLQAFGLTEEPKHGKKTQSLTDFGKLVYSHDTYFEELGTLWLLHYELATDEEMAPSWYYFFNEMPMRSFSRDDFIDVYKTYLKMKEEETSLRALTDDFDCIVRTYLPRDRSAENVTPENNIDCPLGELGLIAIESNKQKTYRKVNPSRTSIPALIVLAATIKYCRKHEDDKEVTLARLSSFAESPGRVFNLDPATLSEIFWDLSQRGFLRITRTAGLDTVTVSTDMSYLDCIEMYYDEIGLKEKAYAR